MPPTILWRCPRDIICGPALSASSSAASHVEATFVAAAVASPAALVRCGHKCGNSLVRRVDASFAMDATLAIPSSREYGRGLVRRGHLVYRGRGLGHRLIRCGRECGHHLVRRERLVYLPWMRPWPQPCPLWARIWSRPRLPCSDALLPYLGRGLGHSLFHRRHNCGHDYVLFWIPCPPWRRP